MIHSSQIIVKRGNYPQDILLSVQTHSDIVNVARSYSDRFVGDALVTKNRNLKIGVLTADCLPIIYIDDINEVIGISHNGWRGIENRLIKNTLEKMLSLGAEVRNIKCHIGPGIGCCCYQISDKRLDLFKIQFAQHETEIIKNANKTTYLDLRKCAKLKLQKQGILEENVKVDKTCTFCTKALPSFRRDGHTKSQIISYADIY